MSSLDRDRMEHFRQRWAEENFNGSTANPSSSSATTAGDNNPTEVAAAAPVKPRKPAPAGNIYKSGNRANRSWRESLGLSSRSRSQERFTDVAAPKRYTFQPRNPDEETALPTIPDFASESEHAPSLKQPSPWVTEMFTVSWLIFFSLLGTLSRLGVEAITQYPNAPVTSRVLWANVGGSFVMGFLNESKTLFRKPTPKHLEKDSQNESAAEYNKWKKSIPLYAGLATGYCGSFTSFSTFIRDAFLELTNALDSPSPTTPYQSITPIAHRNGGFSFLALLGILIIQPAASVAALQVGAHFALLTAPVMPNLNRSFLNKFLNPLMVPLSIGCWLLCSLILSIIPPYNTTEWRTRAMFPLVFGPIGCLLRYYLSKYLNPINSKFPWGTFASNIFGTVVLGMCWDLQHADLAGLGVQSATACAVLVGVQEGFCGCLTTVSTWVVELTSLGRKNAWIYGTASVAAGLSSLIMIMGSMGWTVGFGRPACG